MLLNKRIHFILGCVSIFCFVWSSHAFALQVLHVHTAYFTLSIDHTPPNFKQATSINLPHKHSQITDVSGWYQLKFQPESIDSSQLAVYLPSVHMNAEVFLNGIRIGSGGNMTSPVARNWHTPLLFALPNNLLQSHDNSIEIHVVSASPGRFIFLDALKVGDASILHAEYNQLYFEKQTLYIVSILLSLLAGCLMLYLWSLQRESAYLWFALSCFVWVTASLDLVLTYPPLPTYAWQATILWLVGWMPVTLTMFLYQYMGIRLNYWGKAVFVYGFILFPLLWMIPVGIVFKPILLWFSMTMMMGLHTVILLYKHRIKLLRQHPGLFRLLFSSIAVCYVLAIHDFLYVLEVIDLSSRLWLALAIPLMLVSVAAILMQQFSQTMKDIKHVNQSLKDRINQAEVKIKSDFDVISSLGQTQAVAMERKRIFGALHDDLGAKLLSLIYKSKTMEQKQRAKQAMQSLREIVTKTSSSTVYTTPTLAWRKECQQRAAEHQAKLKWHQAGIEDHHSLPEDITKQLSMVLREAFSNALKHGDGGYITIRIHVRFAHLFMSVRNDGVVLHGHDDSGRGKYSMQQRIDDLGGLIRWQGRKKGGCHVIWAVPIAGEI